RGSREPRRHAAQDGAKTLATMCARVRGSHSKWCASDTDCPSDKSLQRQAPGGCQVFRRQAEGRGDANGHGPPLPGRKLAGAWGPCCSQGIARPGSAARGPVRLSL
ncbi:unnamed protein product, partial [Amoebophrya sp. A120]